MNYGLLRMAANWRGLAGAAAMTIALASTALPAAAQDVFPSQSIRILITNPAGGLPDTVARLYGRYLEPRLGQSVIVENRPGANGAVAVNAMMAAPANGYTLVVTDGAIYSTNPVLYPGSHSEKDLKPSGILARAPLFLAAHPKVGVKTLSELLAYARANPGKLNYGSSGVGSSHHLSMVAMAHALKLEMVHVPFKGTGESVPALLGGHVDILFSAFPSLSGAANTDKVRMLAANTARRSTLAPDIPALGEMIPDYDFPAIIGLYARAGTPDAASRKMAEAAAGAAREKDLVEKLSALGVEISPSTPEEHLRILENESRRVRPLIETAGLKSK